MTTLMKNIATEIDLSTLSKEISQSSGDRRTWDPKFFNLDQTQFKEISDKWESAGYKSSSIEWYNYYSGIDFDEKFTLDFADIVNAIPVKVWVSEIRPGKCFPIHWDVDDDTSQYQEGKMVRYSLYFEDYSFGHFFILENEYIFNYKAGDLYKWTDYRSWHAGGNIGTKSKFTFNFLGKNDG
jgi:hypothetical protein